MRNDVRDQLHDCMPLSPEHSMSEVRIESMQYFECFKKLDEDDTQSLTQDLLPETSNNGYSRIRESVVRLFKHL